MTPSHTLTLSGRTCQRGTGRMLPLAIVITLLVTFLLAVTESNVMPSLPSAIHGVNLDNIGNNCRAPLVGGGNTMNGPNDAREITALQSWHINMVRIMLNEDCWLGINGLPVPPLTSSQYQSQIASLVSKLTTAGIYAELALEQTAPGTNPSNSNEPGMPDQDHALTLWGQVAAAYKSNPLVSFDLYNEPSLDDGRAPPTAAEWQLWLNGGAYTDPVYGTYNIVGMNQMILAVRNTGADNVIITSGLNWATDYDGWVANKPSDPDNNLAAGIHLYPETTNPTVCWHNRLNNDASCWALMIAPLRQTDTPVFVEEYGEEDCDHATVDRIMPWMDANTLGGLAWIWDTEGGPASCTTGWSLIQKDPSNWEIPTPTSYGQGVHDYYVAHPV